MSYQCRETRISKSISQRESDKKTPQGFKRCKGCAELVAEEAYHRKHYYLCKTCFADPDKRRERATKTRTRTRTRTKTKRPSVDLLSPFEILKKIKL